MKTTLIFFLLLFSFLSANEELTEKLKKQLKGLASFEQAPITIKKGKCWCETDFLEREPQIFVAMSFSLPDAIWVSLSKELEREGGVFVIRGLPNNSFKEFANKIISLKQKGVNIPIQLNPEFFQAHHITSVPSFIAKRGQDVNKIGGNISLEFALGVLKESY